MNETALIGRMPTITSPYPPEMGTCQILEIEQPCSSDSVYRVICERPWILTVKVNNLPYSKQEIGQMQTNTRLGEGGSRRTMSLDEALAINRPGGLFQDTPQYDPTMPPAMPFQDQLAETFTGHIQGVREQLAGAAAAGIITDEAAPGPLDLNDLFRRARAIQAERQAATGVETTPYYQSILNPNQAQVGQYVATTFDMARRQEVNARQTLTQMQEQAARDRLMTQWINEGGLTDAAGEAL